MPQPAGVGTAAGASAGGWGIIRIVILVLVTLGGTVIGAFVIGLVLIVTGNPDACADRTIPVSSAASGQLRALWDGFKADVRSTGSAQATFTEPQVTSRGVEYIDEKGAPVDDLQVYFCAEGYADAKGKISILGMKSTVVVSGTLDLSGEQPRIEIDSVRAGNLPSAIARRAVIAILNAGDLRTLDIDDPIDRLTIGEEFATIEAGP